MLLLEHQETEDRLKHLRERAAQMSQKVNRVATWLSPGDFARRRPGDYHALERTCGHTLGELKAILNADEILSVVDEIRETEKALASLSARKETLGLK